MPKTLFQNVIFTLMMSFLMVYVMICYNICLNVGGMSNEVFLMAFGELKIMWPVAFVLEFAFVDKLAHMLAFRIVTPQDRPIFKMCIRDSRRTVRSVTVPVPYS